MRKLPDEAKSEIVSADHPDGKLAVLHYQVHGRTSNLSLVEIQLETGRTHQIRLQLSARGSPIVGDSLYGSQMTFGEPTADLRKQAIALHARRLAFTHPIEQTQVDITAPLSVNWKQFSEFSPLLD
jgi:23S rRNA pseudouridine1911/1915/1917 synthase